MRSTLVPTKRLTNDKTTFSILRTKHQTTATSPRPRGGSPGSTAKWRAKCEIVPLTTITVANCNNTEAVHISLEYVAIRVHRRVTWDSSGGRQSFQSGIASFAEHIQPGGGVPSLRAAIMAPFGHRKLIPRAGMHASSSNFCRTYIRLVSIRPSYAVPGPPVVF